MVSLGEPGVSLLSAVGLSAGYSDRPVVHGLDLTICSGEVVALLGPNGAGKSTTLLALSGQRPPLGGEVVWLNSTADSPLHRRARMGMAYVPEERSVFRGLTTLANLKVGRGDVDLALDLFPELRGRLRINAGLLSGGEQQMISLGRALSRRPRVLLADELSLGLAPLVVDRLLVAVREAANSGVAVLLVEQHVRQVLAVSDRAYVLSRGRITFSGPAAHLRADPALLQQAYLSHRDSTLSA